jgi:hypothetical protein
MSIRDANGDRPLTPLFVSLFDVVLRGWLYKGENMFTKFYRSVAMMSTVSLLTAMLVVSPVAAQGAATGSVAGAQQAAAPTPGTSRETAGGPLAGALALGPKATHWYKFTYHYDNSDLSNEPTNAVVELKMDIPGCVAFQVQNRRRLDFPFDNDGNALGPVGTGTPEVAHNPNDTNANGDGNLIYPARLLWVGSQRASDHFYVIVTNKTTNSTCHYTLSISGPDVSF